MEDPSPNFVVCNLKALRRRKAFFFLVLDGLETRSGRYKCQDMLLY